MRPDQADTSASPQRVSATPCDPGHTRPCTEIHHIRPGSPKRGPEDPQNSLYRSQTGRLSWIKGLIASFRGQRSLSR